MRAILVVLHPVLFFFYFLYYTDPAAVFFALLCYLLALRGHPVSAAAAATVSIACRQTGIVWAGFAAGAAALTIIRGGSGVGAAGADPPLFWELVAAVRKAVLQAPVRR